MVLPGFELISPAPELDGIPMCPRYDGNCLCGSKFVILFSIVQILEDGGINRPLSGSVKEVRKECFTVE